MKKLFIILTIISLLCINSKFVFAKACDNIVLNPNVELSTSYGKLSYDFGKSLGFITSLAKEHNGIEQGFLASGLAVVNIDFDLNVTTISEIEGENNICVVPTSVKFFIGYKDPTIYIANNLEYDSCQFRVTLRHEQAHLQINKTLLDYFLPMFEEAVNKIVMQVEAKHVRDISEIDIATHQFTEEYAQKLQAIINIFKEELATEQSKLDNRTNYKIEESLCKRPSRNKRR